VERVVPIDEVEADLRKRGVFILVDVSTRKLWFYGYKPNQGVINQMIAAVKDRREEMVKFLLARASVRGETK